MERRIFIKNGCLACMGGGMLAAIAAGCKGIHYVSSNLVDESLLLPKSEFAYLKKKVIQYRQWVVVKNPRIPFPIGVFRADDAHFFATYLECSHQGCEVQPEGNYLQCPCHGSEFDSRGKLQQGPAEADLKSFSVRSDADNLYILLK